MKRKLIVAVALVFAAALGVKSAPVLAEGLAKTSEKLTSVASDQTVDGSVYLAGETVTVDGTVKGDVYCAGNSVTISGTVDGDVLCGAQNITVGGTVRGDVRVAGKTVILKGVVGGNVSAFGMDVVADSAAKIGRDIVVGASHVDISGSVSRDTVLMGSDVNLGGIFGRDVRVETSTIQAATTAKVAGKLTYTATRETTLPSGIATGGVTYVAPEARGHESFGQSSVPLAGLATIAFLTVMSLVVLTLLVVLVLPRYVRRASDISGSKEIALNFLVGLVAVVVVPVFMFMLAITGIGLYAAIVLGVAMLLTILVGTSLVAYRVGRFMLADRKNAVLCALAGSCVVGVIGIVPYIGWLAMLVSCLVGVGMIVTSLKSQYVVTSVETQNALVKKAAPKSVARRK